MCTASLQIASKTFCFELSMQMGSCRGVKALADLMREDRRKEEPGARTNQNAKLPTSEFNFSLKNYQERRYCIVIAVFVEFLAYFGHSVKITNN